MSLKVMMDKKKSKVLFAEASSDVVDALLTFLAMPLGEIVKILENHYGSKAPIIGSLTTLYRGLSGKISLILRSSFHAEWRNLKHDFTREKRAQYFKYAYQVEEYSGDARGAIITITALSFILTDDLRVAPIDNGFIQTLNNLGITDIDFAEINIFDFGIDQIMELLKFSLISSTPLTDLVMSYYKKSFTSAKADPGILLHHFDKGVALESSKIMLKVYLQKSTDKLLFAQATDEFVELLLCFLTVPSVGVESLFGGNTCFRNFVNLSRSVSEFIDNKHFRNPDTKKRLLEPKLAHGHINKDLFQSLTSEQRYSEAERRGGDVFSVNPNQGKEKYVEKNAIFYVTDDLTVSSSMVTMMSTLKRYGIFSLSEVREMEVQIGLEEVLRVLKAALSSTTALIINPMLNKLQHQPKQEC